MFFEQLKGKEKDVNDLLHYNSQKSDKIESSKNCTGKDTTSTWDRVLGRELIIDYQTSTWDGVLGKELIIDYQKARKVYYH